ncbi:hypothetical protein CYY_004153 [Polysphondylium violaceum]|uniref:Transmembrane protein n=1 Tax=Polysphondylium violaceum TaxID=133409 RepID=A0A8J4PVU9_9MYCE|nr:hypothetical protein CYY_004153 [Polysphondylium violaceum]
MKISIYLYLYLLVLCITRFCSAYGSNEGQDPAYTTTILYVSPLAKSSTEFLCGFDIDHACLTISDALYSFFNSKAMENFTLDSNPLPPLAIILDDQDGIEYSVNTLALTHTIPLYGFNITIQTLHSRYVNINGENKTGSEALFSVPHLWTWRQLNTSITLKNLVFHSFNSPIFSSQVNTSIALVVDNCVFIDSVATIFSIVASNPDPSFQFIQSKFINLQGSLSITGGQVKFIDSIVRDSIFRLNIHQSNISMIGCVFVNNTGNDSQRLIELVNSHYSIQDCTFKQNQHHQSILYFQDSIGVVCNTQFKSNSAIDDGLIYSKQGSMSILNSKFRLNSGSMIVSLNTTVVIGACLFSNNYSLKGTVSATNIDYLYIYNTNIIYEHHHQQLQPKENIFSLDNTNAIFYNSTIILGPDTKVNEKDFSFIRCTNSLISFEKTTIHSNDSQHLVVTCLSCNVENLDNTSNYLCPNDRSNSNSHSNSNGGSNNTSTSSRSRNELYINNTKNIIILLFVLFCIISVIVFYL